MKKIREHYCWVIVLCAGLLVFCSNGLIVNCISIHLGYLRSVWGYTNSEIALFNTIKSLFSLLSVFCLVLFYKKISLRTGMAFWCAMSGVAYILGAWAYKPGVLYLMAAILGCTNSLGGIAVASMLVRRWFKDRLGLAVGLFSCSTGIATIFAPSIVTKVVESRGLSFAYRAEGLLIVGIALVIFLLTRSEPGDIGARPYTYAGVSTAAREKNCVTVCRSAISRKEWIWLSATSMLMGLGLGPALNNFSMHFTDCGFSAVQIAASISIYGICISTSKLLFGVAVDRFGGRRSTVFFTGILVASFAMVALLKYIPSPMLLMTATGMCGFGFTGVSMGSSIWSADLNTPEHYDETIRRFQMTNMIGGVIGSLIPGPLADYFGSYVPAYVITVITGAVALLSLWLFYGHKTYVVSAAQLSGEKDAAGAELTRPAGTAS